MLQPWSRTLQIQLYKSSDQYSHIQSMNSRQWVQIPHQAQVIQTGTWLVSAPSCGVISTMVQVRTEKVPPQAKG